MTLSTCEISVEGRNQTLFLQRLKMSGVSVLSVNIIDNKRLIIKIKCTDISKVFEISKNMWYNKIVAYHGLKKVTKTIARNAVIIVSAIIFLICSIALDNFVLGVDLSDVPKNYRKRVERIISGRGIKVFYPFSAVDKDVLESEILSLDGVDFVRVEKKGYRLGVSVNAKETSVSAGENVSSIVSGVNGVIKSIAVYRGRALKKVGDQVFEGEAIVDGVTTLSDESTAQVFCRAFVVIEKAVTEEFTAEENTPEAVNDAVACAMLNAYGDDARYSVDVTPVGQLFVIKVTVYTTVTYGER